MKKYFIIVITGKLKNTLVFLSTNLQPSPAKGEFCVLQNVYKCLKKLKKRIIGSNDLISEIFLMRFRIIDVGKF